MRAAVSANNLGSTTGPQPADYCNPANVEESWRDRAEFVRIAAQKLEAVQQGERAGLWRSGAVTDGCLRLLCGKARDVQEQRPNQSAAAPRPTAGGIKARFHVGDAPMDVQAAVGGGAQAIGVCTGIYTKQELSEAAPGAVVLDDLIDTAAVLQVLGLS